MPDPVSARRVPLLVWVLLAAVGGGVALYLGHSLRLDAQKAAADAGVRAVLTAQQDAWNAGDLDGFMAGYWMSDAATFYSGGTVTTGWVSVMERYRKRYQAPGTEMGQLKFEIAAVDVTDAGTAVVRGKYILTRAAGVSDGLFTLLVRKTPAGWKIVHDHTSSAAG